MTDAVLLVAHGTVEDLDDLPKFVANIRRGQGVPPELVAEVRRRYEAIGGSSPLNEINRLVAEKLEARLGVPVRPCNRLWHPYPREVMPALRKAGATRMVVVPLAQHSAPIYEAAVRVDAVFLEVACAKNWGQTPALVNLFADLLREAVEGLDPSTTTILMTAHSLPTSVLRSGDPYEREVRASADLVAQALGGGWKHAVAFQSQGFNAGNDWLGPDLKTAMDQAVSRGDRAVVVAPIGFLADHVEILYDLDIEAADWAQERGLEFRRTELPNASEGMIDVLVEVASPLLQR